MTKDTVPFWPVHKRPDKDRDKYGPLPNTNIPLKKLAKNKFKRNPRTSANEEHG